MKTALSVLMAAAASVPSTGDDSQIGTWFGLLVLSAVALIAIVVIYIIHNKKSSRKEEENDTPTEE